MNRINIIKRNELLQKTVKVQYVVKLEFYFENLILLRTNASSNSVIFWFFTIKASSWRLCCAFPKPHWFPGVLFTAPRIPCGSGSLTCFGIHERWHHQYLIVLILPVGISTSASSISADPHQKITEFSPARAPVILDLALNTGSNVSAVQQNCVNHSASGHDPEWCKLLQKHLQSPLKWASNTRVFQR